MAGSQVLGGRGGSGLPPHGSGSEPVIFLVADDGPMLDALQDDLERRFGGGYQVVAERSPAALGATLERLAAGPDPVALVIAARRMQSQDGLAVLQQAHELLPSAKRVVLEHRGEWTSGEPVVRAMTLGQDPVAAPEAPFQVAGELVQQPAVVGNDQDDRLGT